MFAGHKRLQWVTGGLLRSYEACWAHMGSQKVKLGRLRSHEVNVFWCYSVKELRHVGRINCLFNNRISGLPYPVSGRIQDIKKARLSGRIPGCRYKFCIFFLIFISEMARISAIFLLVPLPLYRFFTFSPPQSAPPFYSCAKGTVALKKAQVPSTGFC